MNQLELGAKLERVTSAHVTKAGSNANPEWMREARAATMVLIRQGNDFTTDDIWDLLEGTGLVTHEPRALGAIIREFSKDGLITSLGSYRKSMRPECHRRPLALWRPVARHRALRGNA